MSDNAATAGGRWENQQAVAGTGALRALLCLPARRDECDAVFVDGFRGSPLDDKAG